MHKGFYTCIKSQAQNIWTIDLSIRDSILGHRIEKHEMWACRGINISEPISTKKMELSKVESPQWI